MIDLLGIVKSFNDVRALDQVDLHIKRGRIHVLLGENGAGKSTLMKILYGMNTPDSGQIILNGKQIHIKNSYHAIRLGIGMVHQHFMLIDDFTGYENIVLGFEPRGLITFNRKEMIASVDQLAATGIVIDASRIVKTMSVGEKQKIEILKLLYRKSELLIFDEPTAVLSPNEVVDFFRMIRLLKSQGKGIILITHKLHEALEIADVITILRDGKVVADDLNPEGLSREDVARLMVGREVSLYSRHSSAKNGKPRLIVQDISTNQTEGTKLDKISFSIHENEILGIAGVDGNGQRELVEAIAGLVPSTHRAILFLNQNLPVKTRKVIETGIGFIFEDRTRDGIVRNMNVAENIILGYHRKENLKTGCFLSMKKIRANAQKVIQEYSIKTSSELTPIQNLSGGNQQKVIIARILSNDPEIVIISQPTRGVDIGAMEYIHKEIIAYRDKGKSILLISADLDEVKSLSDHLMVIYGGKIVARGRPEDFSDTKLGLYMTGASQDAI
jgi:simple sugar transport system ATP-binding protein